MARGDALADAEKISISCLRNVASLKNSVTTYTCYRAPKHKPSHRIQACILSYMVEGLVFSEMHSNRKLVEPPF